MRPVYFTILSFVQQKESLVSHNRRKIPALRCKKISVYESIRLGLPVIHSSVIALIFPLLLIENFGLLLYLSMGPTPRPLGTSEALGVRDR